MLAKALDPGPIGDEAYLRFCDEHPEWLVERVGGQLLLTPPMVPSGARREARLLMVLGIWAETHDYVAFSPSLTVRLANDDIRMPDAALMCRSSYDLDPKENDELLSRARFDVVVELVSKTDRVVQVERKCEEAWFADGNHYVLMLDPIRKTVRAWGEPPADFPSPEELLAEILR